MKRLAFLAICFLALCGDPTWAAPPPQTTLPAAQARLPQAMIDMAMGTDPFASVGGAPRARCGCAITGVCTCPDSACECPACHATGQGARYQWRDEGTASPILFRNGQRLGVWSRPTSRFYPDAGGSVYYDGLAAITYDPQTQRVTTTAPATTPPVQFFTPPPAAFMPAMTFGGFGGGGFGGACRGGG